MRHANEKRFETFFAEDKYVVLKNYFYNYLLRKRIVSRTVDATNPGRVLEVGSGLSPMITARDNVVYSELSYLALKTLKNGHGRGAYVVADSTKLPFRSGSFSHTVCSEVLEHVENDVEAMRELARVMQPGGIACITVPHRKFYFAADDRYVRHFRRYETDEVTSKLAQAGLTARAIKKVLGPLEKITMYPIVMTFAFVQRFERARPDSGGGGFIRRIAPIFKILNRAYAGLVWLDAKVMPKALATVIFVRAEKPG